MHNLQHWIDEAEGATAVEYGLLTALIASVIVGIVIVLGGDVLGLFRTVEGRF